MNCRHRRDGDHGRGPRIDRRRESARTCSARDREPHRYLRLTGSRDRLVNPVMQIGRFWYPHRAQALTKPREMAIEAEHGSATAAHRFEQAIGERKATVAC